MSIDKNQRQNCYKRHYWLLYKLHSLCTEPRNKDVKYHNTLNENWFSNLCENGSKNMTFLSEFYSPRNTRFKQKKMTLKVPLKECMCCEKVQLPGECTTRPFLQTAELVLLDHIGKTNPFDVKDLHAFPKVITKIGDQEERGFIAEFKVYEEIIKSNLPIYIFYSLKPIDKNEELGDFLLVTNSSVIVLEVKAFELHTNPSKQDYEIIQKILSKPKNKAKDNVNLKITQKERVTKEIETFLKKHDCKLPTIKYFTLFVNIKRPEEATINFEDALFQDNYLQEIKGLSTIKAEYNAANESSQYSLRMLLAWFYGTYLQSYIKLGTLKLEEDGIVKKELDEEYKQKAKRMNKDVSGIFLTPAQKVIVESNQPYLQITGLPGTGKTYCLLLKMVQVFFELWQLRRQNPNSAKEIIIVFHRNDITIQFIKRMFWQTVEKQLARIVFKKSEEMSNLIRFIGGKNLIDIDSKALFYVDNYELDPTFKIFIDDVSADIINFDDTNRIYELFKAIDYSNFCWYTSYSVIPMLKNFYQPLSLLKIENNKMSHSGRQVYLTDSLRYTACIHALLDVVLDRNESIDVGDLKYPKFERKNFSPGTRVIGKTPQFVLVEDSKDLENKVKELHQYLLEEGLQRNEIAVIRTDVIYEDLLEEIGYRLIRFPTNQICSLDVSHDLRCINSLMEKLCCDNDSEFTFKNLIIKMMVYGQLIVLLDAIIDNFDDYKHINVNFSYPLNKRFDIQLVDDDTKEYLEAWKRQLQATTVDDAISMLEQNGHISMLEEKEEIRAQFKKIHDHSISFLVKILIFILETALFPLLPIIAQNDFHSSKELLNKSQRMNWPTFPFQSNSWSYETISSRKITKFEFTHSFLNSSDKILNTLILDGNEGETRIKMIQYQNNQRLEQKSEAIFNLTSELKTRLNQKEMSDTIHHYYYLFPFGSNLPFDTDEKTLFLDELIHALSNNRRSAFLDILIEHLTLSWKHLNKICSIEPPESVGGFSKDVLNPLRKLNQILRCFQKVRLSFNKLLSLPNQTFRGNELKFFKQSKLEGN
ncbi:hypothetical protein QYM36_017270 [Artemia franciscana]|uniref:Uncharacterized protein n=1 Tax=Artemia franciscana TaxID=6661 RepID=A0AA88KWU8_ARTSF|nr:hypothetical protein QYM36_017270 [Artemia franciscana]